MCLSRVRAQQLPSAITQNRPMKAASGTLIPAEACRLRGHGQCLERREETTSLSSGTAGLVAAAHPASDPCPSGNRRRVPESGGDCGASAQWLGGGANQNRPKPAIPVVPDARNPNPKNLSTKGTARATSKPANENEVITDSAVVTGPSACEPYREREARN